MVSVAVIVLSLVFILLMIGNLLASALRMQREQKKVVVTETHTADTQGLVLVHTRHGMMVSTRKPLARPALTLPPNWYARLRTCVSLSLLLMVLATFLSSAALPMARCKV